MSGNWAKAALGVSSTAAAEGQAAPSVERETTTSWPPAPFACCQATKTAARPAAMAGFARYPVGFGALTRTFASKLAARAVGARRTAQARRTVNARMGAASEPLQDKVCGTPLGFGPYTVRRLGWPGPGWGRRGQGTGIAVGGGRGLGW